MVDTLWLVDMVLAAAALVAYGYFLRDCWRRPASDFPSLQYGRQPLSARSVKRLWVLVLLLPMAFVGGDLLPTWAPIAGSSESGPVDSQFARQVLVQEGAGHADGYRSVRGLFIQTEVSVENGEVTRAIRARLPWFLFATWAAYVIFVMRRSARVSADGAGAAPPAL